MLHLTNIPKPYRRIPGMYTMACMLILLCSASSAQIVSLNSYPEASPTVYLDFDGHLVTGTGWNWHGNIDAEASGLSNDAITEIFKRIEEDYRIFNINITTDSAVYASAPVAKRIRIIFTPTNDWYGQAGGVSFVNSFTWGDGTPSFVFSELLQKNPKFIGEAASHEIGHTLGLEHQSQYNSTCELLNEYAEGKGEGEIGWAPIMGLGYYRNLTTWNVGQSIEGCAVIQNDIDIISRGFNDIGLRADDHGDRLDGATILNSEDNQFQSTGMINNGADKDVFKIVLPRPAHFKSIVEPGHVAAGNSGANIDIKISMLRANGDTIGRYNPEELLSATVDTNLAAGTYYMVVDGIENGNISDYGSIGYYLISGSLDVALPITRLELRGGVEKNKHVLRWSFESDEAVETATVESSVNGFDFKTLSPVSVKATEFINRTFGKGELYYRIRMTAAQDERAYYSNIISLQYSTPGNISLYSNLIRTSVGLNVSGDYSYQLLDETGRLLQRGRLSPGVNTVQVNTIKKGLLILKVFNDKEQSLFRLIKQ